MKRKDVLSELKRENNARKPIFQTWVMSGKMKREVATLRLKRMQCAESIFDVMTDAEFSALLDRLTIQPDSEPKQGELF